MQEFPPWSAGAPYCHGFCTRFLGFVGFAHQCRDDMAAFEIEIVTWAVKVGRHCRIEIAAVLTAISLAQLDACDLRYGVPFIGGF
jgi:hypothetical protein